MSRRCVLGLNQVGRQGLICLFTFLESYLTDCLRYAKRQAGPWKCRNRAKGGTVKLSHPSPPFLGRRDEAASPTFRTVLDDGYGWNDERQKRLLTCCFHDVLVSGSSRCGQRRASGFDSAYRNRWWRLRSRLQHPERRHRRVTRPNCRWVLPVLGLPPTVRRIAAVPGVTGVSRGQS
jgi:hypothetical protein